MHLNFKLGRACLRTQKYIKSGHISFSIFLILHSFVLLYKISNERLSLETSTERHSTRFDRLFSLFLISISCLFCSKMAAHFIPTNRDSRVLWVLFASKKQRSLPRRRWTLRSVVKIETNVQRIEIVVLSVWVFFPLRFFKKIKRVMHWKVEYRF